MLLVLGTGLVARFVRIAALLAGGARCDGVRRLPGQPRVRDATARLDGGWALGGPGAPSGRGQGSPLGIAFFALLWPFVIWFGITTMTLVDPTLAVVLGVLAVSGGELAFTRPVRLRRVGDKVDWWTIALVIPAMSGFRLIERWAEHERAVGVGAAGLLAVFGGWGMAWMPRMLVALRRERVIEPARR